MRSTRMATAAALAFALAAPLAAQEHGGHGAHQDMELPKTGLRAELIQDIEQLEQKYVALAEAMSQEQYGWRPAEGVRSVSEVFTHVAGANFMIPGMVGVRAEHAPAKFQSRDFEQTVTDRAEVVDALRLSFMHTKHAIAMTPDAALDEEVTMFGRPATKRQVLTLLVTHMHEHLGQAIAYARTNRVVPPWSGGE